VLFNSRKKSLSEGIDPVRERGYEDDLRQIDLIMLVALSDELHNEVKFETLFKQNYR
jgi:hypothetical protein